MRKVIGLAAAALLAAGCTGSSTSGTGGSGSGSTTSGGTRSGSVGAGSTSGGTSGTTSAGATATATSSTGTSGTTTSGTSSSSTSTSTGGTSTRGTSSTGGTSTTGTSTSGTSGASACQGLVPTPGNPTVFAIPPGSQSCHTQDSDGSGIVYLEHFQTNTGSFSVVRPDGTLIGSPQTSKYGIHGYGQLSGLLGVAGGLGSSELVRVGPDATYQELLNGTAFANTVLLANDPTGGVVVWDNGQTAYDEALYAYDASGAQRWKLSFAPPLTVFVAAIGVDRQGNVLALHEEPDGLHGFWVDHTGTKHPDFQLMSAAAISGLGFGTNPQLTLEPQVGGGLFLRAGNYGNPTPDPGSKWIAALDPLGTAAHPAPAWLSARIGTDLHMIHGGSAYGVISLQTNLGSCKQAVEVVTAHGESCGAATFDLGAGACTAKLLQLGYDGTVIQQLPGSMETCSDQYTCSCTWRWWPALFH